MQIRLMSEVEQKQYFEWYRFYHTHFPDFLMCNTIATVEEDGILGAAIMVYPMIGSKLCLYSFVARNPFCDKKFSSDAVDFLIKNLESLTKSIGYDAFISIIGEAPAKARFRKNHVKEFNESMTTFFGVCDV